MSLDILKSKLKENNISGVFLFCGAEEYTKDYYAAQIRNKVDSSPLPEFNHIYFNAAEGAISDLEDAIYSLPYMWDIKLIEITNIESAKLTEGDINEYSRVFSDIPDYLTILTVLRHDDDDDKEKASKKALNSFIKAVRENGVVVAIGSSELQIYDEQLRDVFARADHMMYERKRELKLMGVKTREM